VGRTNVVLSVKLRAKLRVEGERENDFSGAHVLLRVLNAKAPGEIGIGVPSRNERSGAGVVHAHVNLCVFTDGSELVTRNRRNPEAVGRQQTPGLSAQELPLTTLQIHPVNAQAVGVRVGGNENVGGIVAVEIKFNVASDIVGAEFGVRLDVEARVLAGGT